MTLLTFLFIADICGRSGRQATAHMVKPLKEKYSADYIIANVENAAGGFGITPEMSQKIFSYGVDLQTSGNHIWDRVQILDYISEEPRLLRPANYPSGAPGSGSITETINGHKFGVINLQGRTYMPTIDCPFKTAGRQIGQMQGIEVIFVDFHAEATSEKQAMLCYLDGKVSAIVGTHTHVATADEQISVRGTAYITDAGMTGAYDSVIGMDKGPSLGRFLTGMPKRFATATDDVRIAGVVVKIGPADGRATSIERFSHAFDLAKSQSGEAPEIA